MGNIWTLNEHMKVHSAYPLNQGNDFFPREHITLTKTVVLFGLTTQNSELKAR